MTDDDLLHRLQTLSYPVSESMPERQRLTLLILIAREAADYIEHQHVSHDMMAGKIERLTRERDAHVSGWMKQCEIATAAIKRAETAERKVEKLREALRPFAEGQSIHEVDIHTKKIARDDDIAYDLLFMFGELRRARAALKETESEG